VRRALATAVSSLTPRGRCLIGTGAALLLVGVVLGERALVQAGVFVLALPVVSAVVVARERFWVTSRRTVTPARVPRGEGAEVLLELTNADRRPGGLWVLTEGLPGELGAPPQFVVDRLAAGRTAGMRYAVSGFRRGRHVLGPLRLRLVDPFGLVRRTAVGSDTVPLVVVPRVRPLGPGGPAGGSGGTGEGSRRSIAVHGEDDVSTREYRHGDDLRKVHWRATARTGELMVRLEERPWRSSATLLLDTRAAAHLLASRSGPAAPVPGPAGDDDPPPDSLEWVVEAAASIGSALLRRGAFLRVVTEDGDLTLPGRAGLSPEELLDRLAGLTPSRTTSLSGAVDRVARVAGDGPVVCLLGAVGADDVAELVRVRSGPATDVAVLADVTSWADPAGGRSRRGVSASSREELARQREEAARLLRSAGWRVAVAGSGHGVEDVWAMLGAPAGAPGPLGVPA
jgi:uncharacterized protein (DUF58 family)